MLVQKTKTKRYESKKEKSLGNLWDDLKKAWLIYNSEAIQKNADEKIDLQIEIRRIEKELGKKQSEFPELVNAVLNGIIKTCVICGEPLPRKPKNKITCTDACRAKKCRLKSGYVTSGNGVQSLVKLIPEKDSISKYRLMKFYVKMGEKIQLKIRPQYKELWSKLDEIQESKSSELNHIIRKTDK